MAERPRFTLKVGEIYKSFENALAAIDADLAAADRARLANLPEELLNRFLASRKRKTRKTEVFWKSEQQEAAIRAGSPG